MKKLIYLSLVAITIASCQKEEFDPETAFTRIYDSSSGSEGYYPIDVIETSSGYTILTGQTLDDSYYLGLKLLRVDEEGMFLFQDDLTANYVAPASDMVMIDSVGYFFAMNPATLDPVLFQITDSGYVDTPIGGLEYPLAANSTSSGELLLLSYSLTSQTMNLATIDVDGNITGNAPYDIGAGSDIESYIFNHYTDPERSALPFFCGEWTTGSYYFNGVYNYALSLVFTQIGAEPSGVVQGQGFNGGLTAVMPIQGSEFALFGYQFNDNFVVANTTLNTGGLSSSINYLETPISEFKSRSNADIASWQTTNQTYTIIAAETESRQIALYFYEASTGTLAGIHKIGYINPYTLASIKVDSEGNLLILGTTYLSGRFKRVFLTKIPSSDLEDIVN